ncbi:hypothetical protein AR325_25670 (plasmid) [Serratia marcescens]|uniref:fimbrial protein n=1 Tax=Serratia marcescens TaxID=615 RepID=UPI0006ED2355|nr:fimbrial protein [Serratia marcescens]ALL40419.1 hypothetical protein AR325_25670 [Serratia marcescens]
MKLNKIVLAVVMGMASAAHAAPSNQGSGTVKFTGSIIDAPCSITPDSQNQEVSFGQLSNAALKKGGKTSSRAFTIDLQDCTFEGADAKNKVSVTFTGDASKANSDLLAMGGGLASGASIAITEANGTLIPLGKASKATELQSTSGLQQLQFASYVQGDGASATIVEGDFNSIANFTLAYN